jgi:ATPase subunit of ABC transporter with duplicated ATPase domains
MIQGREKPDSGELRVGSTVKLATTEQERESLMSTQSVLEEAAGGRARLELGTVSVDARAYCSWFGFRGADQQKSVSVLSGGERNRCQLAKAVCAGANVLLLDEPTVILSHIINCIIFIANVV